MFGLSLNSISRAVGKGGLFKRPAEAGWLKREEAIMGTVISVELWSDDPAAGKAAIAAVMEEMRRIDRTMSPHRLDSELSRINRNASFKAVSLSVEMTGLLARAIQFSQLSEGAFDITYAAVGRLFDYRLGTRPTDDQLAKARLAVGYQNILLDEQKQTVRFTRPGVMIDLGGFAKGHAVNNAIHLLREHGIAHANVSAGGDSRVLGDRRGRPWMVGIRDPRRAGEVVALLPLEDTSISTSGDYERFFIKDGVRFHHLINPATGKSPSDVRSVTILAEDGLTAEALSKSVFVLGLEKGLKLIESQSGVDAVVVDAAGVLHYSSGLLTPQSQSRN
jgi:thiamine biosynthesis lipoprotein